MVAALKWTTIRNDHTDDLRTFLWSKVHLNAATIFLLIATDACFYVESNGIPSYGIWWKTD